MKNLNKNYQMLAVKALKTKNKLMSSKEHIRQTEADLEKEKSTRIDEKRQLVENM